MSILPHIGSAMQALVDSLEENGFNADRFIKIEGSRQSTYILDWLNCHREFAMKPELTEEELKIVRDRQQALMARWKNSKDFKKKYKRAKKKETEE